MSAFFTALNPMTAGSPVIAGLIWLMMVMYVLTLLLQKESNVFLNILMAIALVCGIINELSLHPGSLNIAGGTFQSLLTPGTFVNFLTTVAMFVLPLVVVGMTKTARSRLPGILGVLMAALFIFWSWFTVWRKIG
jgi:hypothetical protein